MISKRIKTFFNIPVEFPILEYTRDYLKWIHSNPLLYSRDQFFKRYKYYQSFSFDKLIRFHESGSKIPIDIFIPTVKKDLEVLPQVLKYARLNIRHPINKIYIVAPDENKIREEVLKLNCIFVDERAVLGYGKEKINYHFEGIDASGWLFQQLLKLNAHNVCEKEHILILDSDLIIINPKKFEHNGKYIIEFSNEFHTPYFETFNKLLRMKHQCPVSFVTHHMLFRKSNLMVFQQHIENIHQKKWDTAIIEMIPANKRHFFSEYETYANFIMQNTKDSFIFEYWFNTVLGRDKLLTIEMAIERLKTDYKTVTFPGYLI